MSVSVVIFLKAVDVEKEEGMSGIHVMRAAGMNGAAGSAGVGPAICRRAMIAARYWGEVRLIPR